MLKVSIRWGGRGGREGGERFNVWRCVGGDGRWWRRRREAVEYRAADHH